MPAVTLVLVVIACFTQTTQPIVIAAVPGVASIPGAPMPMAPPEVSSGPTTAPIDGSTIADPSAAVLADQIMKASGGDMWTKAKRLRFTCRIEQSGQPTVEAIHDWDIRNGLDSITWEGKTVAVDLKAAPTDRDADAKTAFERWTNDSAWLLSPLRIRDAGATLTSKPPAEIGGTVYDVLQLSFAAPASNEPARQYTLYVDPHTHFVRHWGDGSAPDGKITGTWDTYTDFAGLRLSTSHIVGSGKITFTDITVDFD